jgi:hypothetical protein
LLNLDEATAAGGLARYMASMLASVLVIAGPTIKNKAKEMLDG